MTNIPLSVWQVDPVHLTPYYNLALCSGLAQQDCNVHYATSRHVYDTALLYPSGVQIHFFYFPQVASERLLSQSGLRPFLRILHYPLGHYHLLRTIIMDSSSIVHLQWARLPFWDVWLIDQLHERAIPVVFTAHDIEPLFSTRFDLSKIYAAVDAIIVHTQANRNMLLLQNPRLSQKIHVIPHPAYDWVLPPQANRALARSYLSLPDDAPVILFFGSARRYKRLDLLVEAFMLARIRRPDLYLLVAGFIDDSTILASLHAIQALVEPTYIPSDMVWIYHLAADLSVFPYEQISQSGELITAMHFGLPVIVTDVGGMPETLNGNGWVVPPNDPQALYGAILDAFSDMERLKTLGRQSQSSSTYYSPAFIAQETMKIYEKLML